MIHLPKYGYGPGPRAFYKWACGRRVRPARGQTLVHAHHYNEGKEITCLDCLAIAVERAVMNEVAIEMVAEGVRADLDKLIRP